MKKTTRWLFASAVSVLLSFVLLLVMQAQSSVSLAWDASPTPSVTYNLYRTKTSAGCGVGGAVGIVGPACIKVNSTPIAVLTFSDTPGVSGRWFYVVRATDADGVESVNSNEFGAIILPSPAGNLRKM